MNTTDSHSPALLEKVYAAACELHQKGQYLEAHIRYTQLLEIFPESSSLHYNIGLLFYEQGKYAESLDHYLRALDTAEDDTDLLYNLGLCLKKCEKINEAILVYIALNEKNPADTDCLYNLACCYKDNHQYTQAIEVLRQVLHLHPKHQSATNNLAYLLHLQGNLSEAKRYYEILLELNPHHQAARHMLASVQGKTVTNAPEEYIRTVFNSYADTFDDNLVQRLSYSVPEQLRRGIDTLRGDQFKYHHALDLGCGTGLSGLVLTDICYHLTGVDISEDMVEKARAKEVYTTLVVDEILRFLKSANTFYDLVMLADVLIYLGDIAPVLAALQIKTSEDALLCFSIEKGDEADFQLQPTGRFAHSPEYVSSTAERTCWTVAYSVETTLRKEGSEWVEGTLFYLVKDKSLQPFNP